MSSLDCLTGKVIETSQFLAEIAKVNQPKGKSILFGDKVRALKAAEIEKLKAQNNYCADWSRVLVAEGFEVGGIWGNMFSGKVVLGVCKKQDVEVGGAAMPACICGSVITDCEIGNDVVVYRVSNLANYVIQDGAIVYNVGTLTAAAGCSFGVGRELPLANEVGGREVAIYPEITIGVAEKVSKNRDKKDMLEAYAKFIEAYVAKAKCAKGIVCAGARIVDTPRVADTFVGQGAKIIAATAVLKSTILSLPEEQTEVSNGAYVSASLMQWGSEATTMAIVDKSVVCEHAHVERHGKLTESILGPNSGVAEGEATACLLGPFVGFHHQSLLIAAMWPEGKGNVGYGANVGSNHTAKAPDQEIWCGEGTFFGLGVNIKFPANFVDAPYTIIASGVTCLPQKFNFPFSLINAPGATIPGLTPAYNEVFPGWVLSDNIYMVMRNEGKYKKRNKAKREQFVFEVFRPEVVDLMIDARKRLMAVQAKQEVYSGDKVIRGLAKNYMTESSRQKGVDAYTFYIRYYALKGLLARIEALVEAGKAAEVKKVFETKSDCPRWEHERQVLLAEFPDQRDVPALLKTLVEMQEAIAKDVESSKMKDDKRGAQIIPDYDFSHKPASQDSFVKETKAATQAMAEKVKALVAKLA